MVFLRKLSNSVVLFAAVSSVSSLSLQSSNNNNKHKLEITTGAAAAGAGTAPRTRRDFAVEGATLAAAGLGALTSVPNFAVAAETSTDSSSSTSTSTPTTKAGGLPMQGKRAPDFELENSRGNGAITLDKLVSNKKWTVLYFYPGAFTSGCTLEARGFQRDLEEFRKLNAQIVGVSVDPVEKNAQFCTEEKLDFFMLSDKGGFVSKKYGSALSVPGFGTFSNRQTYIIDPSGDLRYIFTDVESKIARHSSEVLAKLSELEDSIKA